jgi:nicotinate-nucleotide pyrophosphorylase (carboxylating)
MNIPIDYIVENIKTSFREDMGSGDITALLIAYNAVLNVSLICREPAVLCGSQWFSQAFLQLDPEVEIEWLAREGQLLQADSVVCQLKGNARAILSAERTALNFLQTLSATATITHRYQSQIADTGCKILDTRKTIPGLRLAQKYAVKCGGGTNHRIGLFDAYLLKENHLAAAGSIQAAVQQARDSHPEVLLEVEVENLHQLQQAIDSRVDRVLLDNFSTDMLRQAVSLAEGAVELEASGNITLDNIREVAECGVDFISIGALTKHIQAIDFSLRYND